MFQIQNGDFWLCENKNGNCKVIISTILDLTRDYPMDYHMFVLKNDIKVIFEGTYDNEISPFCLCLFICNFTAFS